MPEIFDAKKREFAPVSERAQLSRTLNSVIGGAYEGLALDDDQRDLATYATLSAYYPLALPVRHEQYLDDYFQVDEQEVCRLDVPQVCAVIDGQLAMWVRYGIVDSQDWPLDAFIMWQAEEATRLAAVLQVHDEATSRQLLRAIDMVEAAGYKL